jgi:ribosomal protein L28
MQDVWGERGVVNRDLVGKAEGQRPFGKTRRRWEANIKMYLQEKRMSILEKKWTRKMRIWMT